MDVFLIFPKSQQAQKELGQQLAKFQEDQARKNIQKLPCGTEQKLELVDAAVKHLKAQQTGIESRSACFSDIPCESLLIFFFQKPLEQRGIIACAVGNVVHINHFSDQPVHADILSGDHISVSAVSQFFILRDMAGQRKQLQPGI